MEDKWTHLEIDLTTSDPKTTNLIGEIYPDGELMLEDEFMDYKLWLNKEQMVKLYQGLKDYLYPND